MTKLTIFTPTYNRADLLIRGYESLKKQSCKDFIWMIIDDGSTDKTQEFVHKWQKQENGFEIQYYHKANGGLHTGYNEAIKHAKTDLMVCIDSDDYMPPDAVKKIIDFWNSNGSNKYAGIAALDAYKNGDIIGDKFPDMKSINLIDLLVGKYKIKNGDRKLVVRTELYKSVAPMPSFGNEKNFNPHYMHIQISQNMDFLVMNEPLCIVEYQENGMSNNIMKQYMNSPNSFAQMRKMYMTLENIPIRFAYRQCIHYVSSCKFAGVKNIVKHSPRPLLTFLAYPLGIVLNIYIKRKCR